MFLAPRRDPSLVDQMSLAEGIFRAPLSEVEEEGSIVRRRQEVELELGLDTFFLSLTFGDTEEALPYLAQIEEEVDMLELRADLLNRFDPDFIIQQVMPRTYTLPQQDGPALLFSEALCTFITPRPYLSSCCPAALILPSGGHLASIHVPSHPLYRAIEGTVRHLS